MKLYITISISVFCHVLQTQYVNIWDNNNDWTGYNDFNFTLMSDKCVISPCSSVTANNNGISYIQKNTNITLYSSIQFQLNLNAYGINQIDYCQIWYNVDDTKYIKHSEYSHSKYANVIINFPQVVTVANKIYIRLQVTGNNGTCYWGNATLKGTIRTDLTLFSNVQTITLSLIIILSLILCLCFIFIVIWESRENICNNKNNNEPSTSEKDMSSLQLSEHEREIYVVPCNTVKTKNTDCRSVLSNMTSDDTRKDKPQHHRYTTETAMTSDTVTFDAMERICEQGTMSLSLSKLTRLRSVLAIADIMDHIERGFTSTDTNVNSITETITDTNTILSESTCQ